MKNRILIVEDDHAISDAVALNMQFVGYGYAVFDDGKKAADSLADDHAFDLALLDIILPGIDGFELFSYMEKYNIPVIYMTAKTDSASEIKGLMDGAEDYIVKPFEVLELLARVEVVLRRYNKTDSVINIGGLVIDTVSMTATRDGAPIALTKKEYDLLLLFARNPRIALYRETIYERVWGGDFVYGTKTVDLHVQRMRKKVGWEGKLVAVNKVGYRLEV